MKKYLCEVCDTYVPDNPLSIQQHNQGKKHCKYQLLYQTTGKPTINPRKNIGSIKLKHNNKYNELKMLFPDKINPMLDICFPNKEVLDEVVELFYNVLLDFDTEIDLSEESIDYLISYVDKLNTIDSNYLKTMDTTKFMSLFITYLRNDDYDFSAELDKIKQFNSLNDLIDNNINSAQQQILFNYLEDAEKYCEIYEEARNDFIKHTSNF